MDALDISEKIKKYWCMIYPKNSGEITKSKKDIKVLVNTPEGTREVIGVYIKDEYILLKLDNE